MSGDSQQCDDEADPGARVRKKLQHRVRLVESRARKSTRKRVLVPLYVWRLGVQVISQWKHDRCPQQAAGLSFQSVLSVVPALALAMAAFRATGAMEVESSLVRFLSKEFLPISAEELSSKLLRLSENINFEAMGLVGLVSTLLIAFFTFNSLEASINHIWRVPKRRSLPKRLLVFYLTATIGSALVGLSLYEAAQFGLSDGWSGVAMSVSIAFSAIFLANYALPATKVRIPAALVGAAVTTISSEIAKIAFAAYVGSFALDRYSGIYGPLAAVPLCLIWIYWSWLMLLLGVEVTHSIQNLRILEGADRRLDFSTPTQVARLVNGRMGVVLLVAVASAQKGGAAGLCHSRLIHDLGTDGDTLRLVTSLLLDTGLLKKPGPERVWSLGRPASQITVLDVINAFRGYDSEEFSYYHRSDDRVPGGLADSFLLDMINKNRQVAHDCCIETLCSED